MNDAKQRTKTHGFKPLQVPSGATGVYFAVISTGEIKIGCAVDIRGRMQSIKGELGLTQEPLILAVLPGYREVESDVHARLVRERSRSSGALSNELYLPSKAVLKIIEEVRALGIRSEELEVSLRPTLSHSFKFDDKQELRFDLTYLQFMATGTLVPRYVLARACRKCKRTFNSLTFLTDYTIQTLGERVRREYLILKSGDVCAGCAKPRPLPSLNAFVGGETRIRLGTLLDRDGAEVLGFDRDRDEWLPLIRFGVRRMAKKARLDHPNDVATLRLQPYTSRHGHDRNRNQ